MSGGPAAVGHPPAVRLTVLPNPAMGRESQDRPDFCTHWGALGRIVREIAPRGGATAPGAHPPSLPWQRTRAKRLRQTASSEAAYLRTSSQFAFT